MKTTFYHQTFIDHMCPYVLPEISKPDVIIGVLNGGWVAAMKAYNFFKAPVYWAQISSYGDDRKQRKLKWVGDTISKKAIKNKKILLCDDILDSGRTLKYVCDMYDIKSAEAFVLVNKQPDTKFPFAVHSLSVLDPKVWVAFPWEQPVVSI